MRSSPRGRVRPFKKVIKTTFKPPGFVKRREEKVNKVTEASMCLQKKKQEGNSSFRSSFVVMIILIIESDFGLNHLTCDKLKQYGTLF